MLTESGCAVCTFVGCERIPVSIHLPYPLPQHRSAGCGLDDWTRFAAVNFVFCSFTEAGFANHLEFYPVGTGGSFPSNRVVEV